MKITKENYFVASAAEFRAIPSKWSLALLRGGEKVRLGNQTFLKNYTSVGGGYNSFSAYWVSADDSTLIRVSDHWSKAATKKVKSCQNIRSCYWWLRGKARVVKKNGRSLTGGIVRFCDMVEA